MGCRSVFEHYSFNNKIDAGVYGDVSRATEKRTGKKVCKYAWIWYVVFMYIYVY
jgi:hypothetical protein